MTEEIHLSLLEIYMRIDNLWQLQSERGSCYTIQHASVTNRGGSAVVSPSVQEVAGSPAVTSKSRNCVPHSNLGIKG